MALPGAPHGYPGGHGHTAYVGQVVPRARTHDVYYECVGLRTDGTPCEFWSYDREKAKRHTLRAGLHGVIEVPVDETQGLPEQVKIVRRTQ